MIQLHNKTFFFTIPHCTVHLGTAYSVDLITRFGKLFRNLGKLTVQCYLKSFFKIRWLLHTCTAVHFGKPYKLVSLLWLQFEFMH